MQKDKYTNVEGLYAFWRYDAYPFLLGGTITRMGPSGNVETEEYGRGSFWKPLFIVPVAEGKAIHKKLKELERGYRDARKTLNDAWLKTALEVTPYADPKAKP